MKKIFIFLCFFVVLVLSLSLVEPLRVIDSLDEQFLTNSKELESANKSHVFGRIVSAKLKDKTNRVDNQGEKTGEVVFKLFGIIPIKRLSATIVDDEEFYVGGVPIGIVINSDGAIVLSDENEVFKEGDIITKLNGEDFESLDEMSNQVQMSGDDVEIEFIRRNKPLKTLIKTKLCENGKKLGLWVKDDVSGIGTLTFINKKTKKYGALGHPILENNSGNLIPVESGKIYKCNLIGINKGKRNEPGELRCVFSQAEDSKGDISSNSKAGLNGTLLSTSGLVDENKTAVLGGRLGVKMGKAKIVSAVSGIPEEYDIEIIKANYQKNASDKSLVFRVTDKRLLALTGGIVQGMSGSPIIQDGKIIGAVTHVFVSDPSKGYGIYVDWMLQK